MRRLGAQILSGGVDAVTLTSSSGVRALARALGEGAIWLSSCVAVCLGAATRSCAEGLGMRCTVASETTVPALVDAVAASLRR